MWNTNVGATIKTVPAWRVLWPEPNVPTGDLETFPNPSPGYAITPSKLCARSSPPSARRRAIPTSEQSTWFRYTPDRLCVELKSLKLYLHAFRNQGIFYEAVTNRLLDDFVRACSPRRCQVIGAFTPRGGISTTVTCLFEAKQG